MKWIVEFMLLCLFVVTLGMFSFRAKFPDGTEFSLDGWLF